MIGQPIEIQIGSEEFDSGVVYKYYTPPMPDFTDMINFELPVLEQKFKRTLLPKCFDDIARDEELNPLWNAEQIKFIRQETERIINGVWYLIKGKPIFFTGDHYFYLNYWWMGAETEDGYPFFKYSDCIYFYFAEIVDFNTNIFGGLYVTQRRDGKSERELCRTYKKAITVENKLFALMSLTMDEAKDNLFAKVIRSWDMMVEFFKPKHSGTTRPTTEMFFGKPPRKSTAQKEKQENQIFLNTKIGIRATKISALQGKKPYYTFLDEAATVDAMDLLKFWSTSKQALALGGGKNIVGKVMMPCTLEEMKENSGERYYKLWLQSNPNELTPNGRTSSGLIRYIKPYWEGLEGFIDEWGFSMPELAKEFVENEYQALVDAGEMDAALMYRRQFPRNANDAFNIQFGESIEEDCQNILKDNLALANDGLFPERPCEIYENNGEIHIKNTKPTKECLYIIEEPVEGVEYVIGIDGTATDKASAGEDKKNKKSDFAIVVTKKLHIGHRSYCEVAYISRVPNRREDMYRIAYCLYRHYNKFGKCKVMAEGNAGNASPLDAYFSNRGSKKGLKQEPKYVGTDSPEVKNRTGFVRTGTMRRTQLDLLNIQIRMFGNHLRSKRLIENILKTGKENTDLSDAFQAAIVGWGNFGNLEYKKEKKSSSYLSMRKGRFFNQQKGRWEYQEEIIEEEESQEVA